MLNWCFFVLKKKEKTESTDEKQRRKTGDTLHAHTLREGVSCNFFDRCQAYSHGFFRRGSLDEGTKRARATEHGTKRQALASRCCFENKEKNMVGLVLEM